MPGKDISHRIVASAAILWLCVVSYAVGAALAAEPAALAAVTPAVVVLPPPAAPTAVPLPAPSSKGATKEGVRSPTFVRVSGPDFVDAECVSIPRLSGYNSFMLLEAAANRCCGGRAAVDAQLDAAAAAGLTLVRFFAFAVLDSAALQPSPGRYDDDLLEGLDYVVAAAGRRGLKLLAVLANNWDYSAWKTGRASPDSKCWYTNATLGAPGAASGCDDFWSNEAAKTLYKNHLKFITQRVNKFTGLAWRDDPTIFANGLVNEPRCEPSAPPSPQRGGGGGDCGAPALQAFIEDCSAALRSFDPNHLITVGEDGFFGEHSCLNELANPVGSRGYLSEGPPGSGWPLLTGQDVASNHAGADVDFVSVHLWSDNWSRPDIQFVRPWLRAQAEVSKLLRKPVLLEEFGKVAAVGELWKGETEENKFRYYRKVYEEVAELSGQIKGILFWRWGEVKTDGDLGDFDKGSMIPTSSRIFRDVIAPFSKKAATMKGRKVGGRCKRDDRNVPFVVVEGGVAVPQAPGAPGLPPAPAPAASAISKGGSGDTSRAAAVVTASAEQQPAVPDAAPASASVAGSGRRRSLSARAEIEPSKAEPSTAAPPTTTTATTATTAAKTLLERYHYWLPPPALAAGPWMGSGQRISAGALRWVLAPAEAPASGSGSDALNATVRKADGEAPPPPPLPPLAPPPPKEQPAAKEEPLPLPLPPPLPPTPPKEEPAAERTAGSPRIGGKVDARALNARISCTNLKL